MLTQPLITRLTDLNLKGMAAALTHQTKSADLQQLGFEDRLGILIEQEHLDRSNKRLAQRLRWAKLLQSASLQDLDTQRTRGMDSGLWQSLSRLGWIGERLNLLITGPTGVGKSYLVVPEKLRIACSFLGSRGIAGRGSLQQ